MAHWTSQGQPNSRWRSAQCGWSALRRSCFCCLASLNFGHRDATRWADSGQAGIVISALALAAMALGERHRVLRRHRSGNRERDWPHDLHDCILDLDRCFDTAGANSCSEAMERPHSLGRSVPVAGGTSGNPVPRTRRRVVVGDYLGFWSALSIPYAFDRILLAVFAPRSHDMTTRPVATRGGAPPL